MKFRTPYESPVRRTGFLPTFILAVAALFCVYPFFWMLFSGFKSNREIFDPLQLLPDAFEPGYYAELFDGEWFPFFRVFGNSVLVSASVAFGAVFLASLAGYAFARHRFRGRRALFFLAIAVIVVPPQVLAVQLFAWVDKLHLNDRLLGVILPGMMSGLGILYFTQVFRQVPDDLVGAARLAGASEWRVYWTLLPLIKPALLTFGFIQFVLQWHEHLIPLLILSSSEMQTLPIAVSSLYGSSLRYSYAVLMAASTLAVVPPLVLFCLVYEYFRSSLSEVLTD